MSLVRGLKRRSSRYGRGGPCFFAILRPDWMAVEPRAVQGGKALHDKVEGVCVVAALMYVQVMVVQPWGPCCGTAALEVLGRTVGMTQALRLYGQLCSEERSCCWLRSSCWCSLGGILRGIGLVLLCSSPLGALGTTCSGRKASLTSAACTEAPGIWRLMVFPVSDAAGHTKPEHSPVNRVLVLGQVVVSRKEEGSGVVRGEDAWSALGQ